LHTQRKVVGNSIEFIPDISNPLHLIEIKISGFKHYKEVPTNNREINLELYTKIHLILEYFLCPCILQRVYF
jgi:hypothetical protein